MTYHFSEPITTDSQIRDILGEPSHTVSNKAITHLDEHCRSIIAKSPFVLIATADSDGKMDVSPKGDPPGFVHVLDDNTLVIPDRKGNRRADTLINIVQNPNVGLLFMIPGYRETLRVNGTAQIVRDAWLLEKLTINEKAPLLAIAVNVEEAFMHCAKCVIRSNLWEAGAWPDLEGVSTLAEAIRDHARLETPVTEIHEALEDGYQKDLY